MSFIKCPQCQRSALSIASQCPGCGAPLGALTLGPEHRGEIVPCSSCGHAVRTRSAKCPHCGLKEPGKKSGNGRLTAGLVGVAILAIIVAGAVVRVPRQDHQAPQRISAKRAPARPAVVVQSRAVEAKLAPPPAPTVASNVQLVMSEPAPLPATNTAQAPSDSVSDVQTRWTSEWANVRAEPRDSSLILEQLPPGTRLEGVRRTSRWWFVYLDGDSIGYVAGSLLREAPPDSSNHGQ